MTNQQTRYLSFGRYTTRCPAWLLRKVKPLWGEKATGTDVRKILAVIKNEFDPRNHLITLTNNFPLSRYVPVVQALRRRQRTCGALSTVVASVFRTLGVPTKLVDGWYRKREPRMRHAWNEILLDGTFVPFDITRKNLKVGKFHAKRDVWVDWHEMEIAIKKGK